MSTEIKILVDICFGDGYTGCSCFEKKQGEGERKMSENSAAKSRQTSRDLVFIALMAAVTAVLAQFSIPMPSGMPLTLQTFAVALCGSVLGWRRGLASVGIYLLLGAVGLPVFASFRGGLGVLLGLTGGFLFGFLALAAGCGWGRDKKMLPGLAAGLVGLALCHVIGVCWGSVVSGSKLWPAFLLFSAPYLLKDAVSVWLAMLLARRIVKQLKI